MEEDVAGEGAPAEPLSAIFFDYLGIETPIISTEE
jgi:hypothetical protein